MSTILYLWLRLGAMPTARDRVWAAALRVGIDAHTFTVDDVVDELDEEAPSRKTVQRTLRGMADLDVLNHQIGSPRYSCVWSSVDDRDDEDGEEIEDDPGPDTEALLELVDVPGWDDDVVADRRAALALTLRLLDERGPMRRSEILDEVYPEHPGNYADGTSLWQNYLQRALSTLADEGHLKRATGTHDDDGWDLTH